MTYALAWALQQALHAALVADPGVAAQLGTRIYDAAPQEAAPLAQPYAILGDESAENRSSQTDRGAVHTVTIAIYAPSAGFAAAKQAAAAISDRLLGGEALVLARGCVVALDFLDARTARLETDALRRVALRFRILVADG
ncbi:MAG: DUF3168 domain-containing protein [Pseudomonadota bacterium]